MSLRLLSFFTFKPKSQTHSVTISDVKNANSKDVAVTNADMKGSKQFDLSNSELWGFARKFLWAILGSCVAITAQLLSTTDFGAVGNLVAAFIVAGLLDVSHKFFSDTRSGHIEQTTETKTIETTLEKITPIEATKPE